MHTFDAAQVYMLSLMENESLATFLSSDIYSALKKRIDDGEMEGLLRKDIESVRDIMSKEVSRETKARGIKASTEGSNPRKTGINNRVRGVSVSTSTKSGRTGDGSGTLEFLT